MEILIFHNMSHSALGTRERSRPVEAIAQTAFPEILQQAGDEVEARFDRDHVASGVR